MSITLPDLQTGDEALHVKRGLGPRVEIAVADVISGRTHLVAVDARTLMWAIAVEMWDPTTLGPQPS